MVKVDVDETRFCAAAQHSFQRQASSDFFLPLMFLHAVILFEKCCLFSWSFPTERAFPISSRHLFLLTHLLFLVCCSGAEGVKNKYYMH